jgi:DNA modification methylase
MTDWRNSVLTGDVRERLGDLPDDSVHMAMTSPPYWNLRDYGHDDQLGLEASPEEYVEHIADVLDAVARVLRPDGSLWLNLGDTYDSKDLQQIPARVALECQSRGWLLRNRVTWAKPNPMPQSVKDRLNDTTEAIFHFVKNKEYWYDLDAIREPHSEATKKHLERLTTEKIEQIRSSYTHYAENNLDPRSKDVVGDKAAESHTKGKNPGDVFEVTTKPFPDAHFAVYPSELCEKPLKATCPPKVCVECGSPYEREVERETVYDHETTEKTDLDRDRNDTDGGDGHDLRNGVYSDAEFKGWTPTCDCDTDATEPGIALDPFAGAGTTLLKAKALGRRFVGIELNPEYADMARARIGLSPNDPANVRSDDAQQGFEAYTDGGDRE